MSLGSDLSVATAGGSSDTKSRKGRWVQEDAEFFRFTAGHFETKPVPYIGMVPNPYRRWRVPMEASPMKQV